MGDRSGGVRRVCKSGVGIGGGPGILAWQAAGFRRAGGRPPSSLPMGLRLLLDNDNETRFDCCLHAKPGGQGLVVVCAQTACVNVRLGFHCCFLSSSGVADWPAILDTPGGRRVSSCLCSCRLSVGTQVELTIKNRRFSQPRRLVPCVDRTDRFPDAYP